MYILKARNRYTCKDDTISTFEDRRLFHSEVDKVDPDKYSDAMIKNLNNGETEFYTKLKKPYYKRLIKTL